MKMEQRRQVSFGLVMAMLIGLVLGLALPAQADLMARGSFDDGLGESMNLIYDTDRDITWLGNANFGAGSSFDDGVSTTDGRMTWQNAVNWADSLTVGGFTDWRLPTTSCFFRSATVCINSEMGHLFTVEGITESSPSPFINLQPSYYWIGPKLNEFNGWRFNFVNGSQSPGKSANGFAWAVRSGDASAPTAVPEPGTMLLMGSGLVGLMAWRRLRRG